MLYKFDVVVYLTYNDKEIEVEVDLSDRVVKNEQGISPAHFYLISDLDS